jgi:hypothetical protein
MPITWVGDDTIDIGHTYGQVIGLLLALRGVELGPLRAHEADHLLYSLIVLVDQ